MAQTWRALLPADLRAAGAKLRFDLHQRLLAGAIPPAEGIGPPSSGAAVVGFFSAGIGIGRAAEFSVAELCAGGLRAHPIDITWTTERGAIDVGDARDEALLFHVNPDAMAFAQTRFQPALLSGRRRIGYWVWELERAPRTWRKAAAWLDEIWAPSTFAANTISNAIGREVRVVPYPVALEAPPDRAARRSAARASWGIGESFVVASSFAMRSSMERKNALGAIAAFARAFGGDQGATLMLRATFCADAPRARRRLETAAARAGANVRVILHEQNGSLEELEDLYAAADAYVSLHRAEGFGLNLAEAMLRGLPVIATAWSGNMDFMDESSALMVPARLCEVIDPQRIYAGGRWAEPDLDAAVAHLRRLRDDPVFAAALGARASEHIRKTLSGGGAVRALRGG